MNDERITIEDLIFLSMKRNYKSRKQRIRHQAGRRHPRLKMIVKNSKGGRKAA